MYDHDRTRDGSYHAVLQDGIYFRHKEGPPRSYRLVLLNIDRAAPPGAARAAITRVWDALQKLRAGEVWDLPGGTVPDGNLTCQIGLGARLFEHASPLLPAATKPAELTFLDERRPFTSLRWADDRKKHETDLAIQLIADTELAVNRAVLEIYRLLTNGSESLQFVTFYGGFNRDDKRSWLGFYDGISNIHRDDRARAIEVAAKDPPTDPEWMVGGTYMVFLRLGVRLQEEWWPHARNLQEILVGRDKLTGCPIVSVDDMTPSTAGGCPVVGDPSQLPQEYKDPPWQARNSLVMLSHMHRANPSRQPPGTDGSHRIFRQGYEFLESLADGEIRAGLNFVSYQCALSHFTHIVETGGWMKEVNFGGPDDGSRNLPRIELARVVAGGYYAVPPRAEPFPGARIFPTADQR